MNYIGMDCHITTLDFAVVNEAGRLIKANSVAISVKGFLASHLPEWHASRH